MTMEILSRRLDFPRHGISRFDRVPVKTEEQQANGIVFRARDLLVRQRTQCVNALRGHLTEYGYVFPKGITHVETLVAVVEDLQSSLPDSVRVILTRIRP